ncbi:MAG: type II secretion system secretin GspD [Bdellovibrionales bacterium]|nr:type II secretion system secretin GspD [Oligoflexia bacterium]
MISDNNWSTRMSFVFGLCAFLGILLLIFSEVGLAQVGGGFRPGGNTIGNPMNDPSAGDDEDFDEFEGESEPAFPKGRGGRPTGGRGGNPQAAGYSGGISVGGKEDTTPGAELRRTRKGYELSGPGTEKGIKSKNEVPVLFVDNESGEGNPADKELITDFNFPNADIMDIAKTLGRLTGKNFLLDKDVKGNVSIISNSPITVGDAWRAFLTALDMNQLAVVPTGKFLRIMRQNDAKGKNVRLYSSTRAPNTDALVTKIFKIKYISAKELENVIRTYANMGARIYGFEQTNTLIITDTGSNIDKIAKMIKFLDVEGFDAGIEVIAVKYASAVEIQKLIDSLLPGTQANFPGRAGFGGGVGGGGGRAGFAARKTKEGGLINNIIADERTNTLIIHANTKGVDQVRELIARLDRKLPAVLGGGKVHVVYLQFADSEEMAKTLNNFSQNAKSPGGGGGFGGGPIGGIGINPNESSLFEGQIKVSSDKTTNSLVITASPSDFATIQRVINKLDIMRDQIYVEIIIMEMNMQRNNDFAANILLPGGTSVAPTNDLFKLLANPTDIANGLVLHFADKNFTEVTVPGTSGASKIQVPNLAALVKAIQTYSAGNVLATPQIMTMDNSEATFDSTDKIPIPQVNNAGLGIQTVTVTQQTVPLTIKIKPQLNKISNIIKLHINAKISDISNRALPKAVQDQAYATIERSVETDVMVADADTIVLGGLVRDKTSEVINKVPILGDIPILGWLFKSRSAEIAKTNLMLFITPKIMRQPEHVRMVLDQKLKERDEFVEKAFGGEDTHRDARNKIIRSLPDLKTIRNYNAKRVINLDDEEDLNKSDKNSAMNSKNPGMNGHAERDTLTLPAADAGPDNRPQMVPNNPGSLNPNNDPFNVPGGN